MADNAAGGTRRPARPEPTVTVIVNGMTFEHTGNAAKGILFFHKHNLFFNDDETTGNVVLALKSGDMQIKNDVAVQL